MSLQDAGTLYQDVILRHARQPHHHHALADADAEGAADNPLCGDKITVQLRYNQDGTVAEAAFQARGCVLSLASADIMADWLRGQHPAAAQALAESFAAYLRGGEAAETVAPDLRVFSGVRDYPSRARCALLPWQALGAALAQEARHDGGH